MTRFALSVASRLDYQGQDLRYVARRGDSIDWVDDRTRERFTFTDAEIAVLLADGTGRVHTGTAARRLPAPIDFEADPEARAAEAASPEGMRKHRYLSDLAAAGLLYGAPEEDVKRQIFATASELRDPAQPDVRTIRRWRARTPGQRLPTPYELEDRHRDKGDRSDRLDPEVRAELERLIDDVYMTPERISVDEVTALLRNRVRELNFGRHGEKLKLPGRDAVQLAVDARDRRAVHASRFGEASAAARFDPVEPQEDPEAPLDLIEIDHTVADLFVVSSHTGLPIGRPHVAMAVDRCTRMPFGIYIGFEPPSVLTVMQVLKNGMMPKTYVEKHKRDGSWAIENSWDVCGTPRRLLMDRALENLSGHLRYAAAELRIGGVRFAARKKPQHKGAIERFFGSLNRGLLHKQRGTTFSNIGQRGDYDPRKNAVVELDELYALVHKWLIDVYARRRHKGIGGDLPIRRWNELTARYPVDPPHSLADVQHLFGRKETRSLDRNGIVLSYIIYNSEPLAALLATPDFLASVDARRNVDFTYDPADLGRIHVYLPHLECYMTVEAAGKWRDYAKGRSIWEHQTVLAFQKARTDAAIDPEALDRARADLHQEKIDGDRRKRRRTRHTKDRARYEGDGRVAPAGDSTATTPDGSLASQAEASAAPKPKSQPKPPRSRQPKAATDHASSKARNLTHVDSESDDFNPYDNVELAS